MREEGLEVLAWRVVPTNPDGLGLQALASMPAFKTLVVADPEGKLGGIELDRKTFRIRKRVEHEVGIYFASLSARTITYKGMLTTMQLKPFFLDLSDERMKAKIAIVHSRFSTNTFPSWPLAQPFRQLAHNGEINTIQGNRNCSVNSSRCCPSPLRATPIPAPSTSASNCCTSPAVPCRTPSP